jgi:hypothetical protein
MLVERKVIMSDGQLSEREIRRRVEKRLKERQEFTIHLIAYLGVNLFLWFLWFVIPRLMIGLGLGGEALAAAGFPWPLLAMGGWGVGLLIHAVDVYQKSGASEARREREIQREIERYRAHMAAEGLTLEKPKRVARLSEDGEIVYDDEAEDQSATMQR